MVISKKDRRNSGRVIVERVDGYDYYWSKYKEYRDGMRRPWDNSRLKSKHIYSCCDKCNKRATRYVDKVKKLSNIRKLRKLKTEMYHNGIGAH